jgi:hypothetical protein
MWLYQINQGNWSPERYRVEIWEGHDWMWPSGKKIGHAVPGAGDTVVFFYAPSGGSDPGFYGWAIVLEWLDLENSVELRFKPVAPSDYLKMNPWWDDDARALADAIRGKVKQGTLWPVPNDAIGKLRSGIATWLRSGG